MTKRKPQGYWQEWDNVEQALRIVIKDLEHFPSHLELQEKGKSMLSRSIMKSHGGMQSVRERMGYTQGQKSPGYWQEWSNVERELEGIIEELGHFPKKEELERLKKTSLSVAITKYHGGSFTVRERMKFPIENKPSGYWQEETILDECKKIVRQYGDLLSARRMKELDLGDLSAQIQRKGGFRHFRTLLGLDQNAKPVGYWKEWSNVEYELQSVIGKNKKAFPTIDQLRVMGESSLAQAISTHHGGIVAVKERFFKGLDIPTTEREQLEALLESYIS